MTRFNDIDEQVGPSKTCPEAISAVLFAFFGLVLFVFTPVLEAIAISKALNARRMTQVIPEWGGGGAATMALGIGVPATLAWFGALVYFLTSWT